MRVLIAPDSFKGSATATEVANAIASGWQARRPGDDVQTVPLSDGGEGLVDALRAAIPGSTRHRVDAVTGPDRRPVDAEWLELPDGVAVIELASSSGLPLMAELDPLGATTAGLGEVIAAALTHGSTVVWLGLGGSASTDAGLGALAALGARVLDPDGEPLPPGGGALARIGSLDLSGLRPIPGGVVLLTDVDAPLCGPTGAAAVFAPQKGASAAEVDVLDDGLARLALLFPGVNAGASGMGAAGGTAFGFSIAYDATIIPGARRVIAVTGVPAKLAEADLLITGEGSFDAQSRGGKIVGSLLDLASATATPAAVVAGAVRQDPGVPFRSLIRLAGTADDAISRPIPWLQEAGAQLADELGH